MWVRAIGTVAALACAAAWNVGPVGAAGPAPDAGSHRERAAASAPSISDPNRPLVISEFRVRGPNGANDEFIEVTNVSAVDHVVTATSGTGYAVAASNGVARCVIPDGTLIPALASYLCVNSVGYSLASYPAGNGTTATGDATYTTDIPDNAGIALFNNSTPADFTLANRLDAVGSTSEANTLYKEGTGYPALTPFSIDYSFYRNVSTASITSTTLDTDTPGVPEDTNNNAADLVFVDTNGTSAGAGQRLGAPGPSNLSSPRTNGDLTVSLLDPCVSALSPPNAVRDFTSDPANNSTFGTVDLRRTITNNTGAPVTRLRLRVADVRTFPAPSGIADQRPRTSTAVVATVDRAPCGSGTTNVTVQGTTLEQPPSQPNGGGFNSSLSVGVIDLASPLAPGASVDVRVLTGLQQNGSGGIRVIAEALTTGSDNTPHTGECLSTPGDGEDLCTTLANNQPITIPLSGAANPYPSTIEADFPAGTTVRDLNLGIRGLSHTSPQDVDVMLVAPDGTTRAVVLSDVGGTTDVTNANLVLDDEAANTVPTPITSGTFRPTNIGSTDSFPLPAPPARVGPLTDFDGTQANGTWRLYVADDGRLQGGSIAGWSLDLDTAPGCEGRPATIVGTNGPDTLIGTPGNDVIVGLDGADDISGDGGDDRICGGRGDDDIRDQDGADRVFGDAGNDDFVMTATADERDVVHGGEGDDSASYRARSVPVSLTVNGASDDGAAGENDRLLAVEDLTGGSGADFISGNANANDLFGGAGDDTLRDLPGLDNVFGGEGDDTMLAPGNVDANDDYNGGPGTDLASYAARSGAVELSLDGESDDGGTDERDQLVSVEDATGGAGNDTITGSGGPNVLSGGGGADEIRDLLGADEVFGGPGDDLFVQPGATDPGDTFSGGADSDTISYAARSIAVTISLDGGPNDGVPGETDEVNGTENATGGSGGDTIAGTAGSNILVGGGGSDSIRDLGGADDVSGGTGDDTFVQASVADAGDVFDGGGGTDEVLYVQRGGRVVLTLGNATDDDGAAGENDNLVSIEDAAGGDGDDDITGSGAGNLLRGGVGADVLRGLVGPDRLLGEDGADRLLGLDGIVGNDTVNGGTGTDTATSDPGDTRISIP